MINPWRAGPICKPDKTCNLSGIVMKKMQIFCDEIKCMTHLDIGR